MVIIDESLLAKYRGLQIDGEPDFVDRLIGVFLAESPGRMERLRAALSTGDRDGLHNVSHTMKSSAALVGATSLAAVCRTLDELSQGDGPSTALAKGVTRVMREYELAAQALSAISA